MVLSPSPFGWFSLQPPLDGMVAYEAFHQVSLTVGRCSVSALDSGFRGAGLRPGCIILLCSWSKYFTLTVLLSSLDYKWVLENGLESLIKFWGGGFPHNGLASIILQIVSF